MSRDAVTCDVTELESTDTRSRPRALGYVRVSTDEQTRGYGLDAQERAIRDYCRAERLRLVDVLCDEALSGSNGLEQRAGLAEALAILEAGGSDVLVVARLDRLARDLLVQETVIERLARRGCAVRSAAEPDVTSDDPTRVLVRQVLGAIAQYERGVIRGRMLAGKAAKGAQGGYTGGQPRYGTRAENRELVTHDEEAVVADRARSLRDAGYSYRAICQMLEAEGLGPRRADHWQAAVIRRIVLDRR
jgi:DNA invertase Pin-like site-specific DNA recombinase